MTAVEEAEAQKMFNSVAAIKADCQEQLDKAMPIYKEALAALDTLNKADITEMKAYTAPAEEIVMVISAVCLLVDKKENWDEGKKLMNNPNEFIETLKTYDKDNIKPSIMKIIRKKFVPDEDFTPDKVKKASVAAQGLCKWCLAMEVYDRVAKEVEPKKKKLAESEGKAKQELETKMAEFDMLAGVVKYERAVGNEEKLYPAWPGQIEAMLRWLDELEPALHYDVEFIAREKRTSANAAQPRPRGVARVEATRAFFR